MIHPRLTLGLFARFAALTFPLRYRDNAMTFSDSEQAWKRIFQRALRKDYPTREYRYPGTDILADCESARHRYFARTASIPVQAIPLAVIATPKNASAHRTKVPRALGRFASASLKISARAGFRRAKNGIARD